MSTKACPRPDGPPCTLGLPWSLSAIDCVLLKVNKVRLTVAGALRVRPLRRLRLSRLQGRLRPRDLQVGGRDNNEVLPDLICQLSELIWQP